MSTFWSIIQVLKIFLWKEIHLYNIYIFLGPQHLDEIESYPIANRHMYPTMPDHEIMLYISQLFSSLFPGIYLIKKMYFCNFLQFQWKNFRSLTWKYFRDRLAPGRNDKNHHGWPVSVLPPQHSSSRDCSYRVWVRRHLLLVIPIFLQCSTALLQCVWVGSKRQHFAWTPAGASSCHDLLQVSRIDCKKRHRICRCSLLFLAASGNAQN